MKKITENWLKKKGACQLELFKKYWPKGGIITKTNLLLAASQGFDLDWLAREILMAPAWAEYERIMVPAWTEYERIKAPALAEYERIKAPALAEYERIKAPALAEYQRIMALAWAEYQRIKAPALWEAWKTQEGMQKRKTNKKKSIKK